MPVATSNRGLAFIDMAIDGMEMVIEIAKSIVENNQCFSHTNLHAQNSEYKIQLTRYKIGLK